VEVYWRAPNLSKQLVVGHRDTLLLPATSATTAIVTGSSRTTSRFDPPGRRNDVRGVPHPLAPHGPEDYDYRVSDSLRITIPGRVVEVYAIQVRPKDPEAPRIVGTIYA